MSTGFHSKWWSGTAAERGAFSTTGIATPFWWFETDTGYVWWWESSAWKQVGSLPISAADVEVEEIGTATYDDVQDWINNTQSAGRLTGGAVTAHAYPITGVTAGGAGAGEFEIAGDHTAAFGAAVVLTVSGSTGNDGDYTVSAGGATHAGGTTTIPVDEAIPDGTVDGNITAGTVGVASGTGFIKDADSNTAPTLSFDWAATTTPLIPTNDTSNWVYLDYNGGSPVVGITDDHDIITRNDIFVLDRLWREDSTLHIIGRGQNAYNVSMRAHRNLTRVFHFQRGNGVKLTEKGTRKVGVSAGNIYRGLNEIPIAKIDTSVAGTFTTLYRDGGGGWTQVTGQTTIDNTNYDDGSGVLQGITNNQYGVYWAYIDYGGGLHIQYGQDSYHLGEAEVAQFPATRTFLDKFAMLIAKIVVEEGALENFYSIEYPWDVKFVGSPIANHNNLGGLQGGAADEYYHFTSAQHTVLTGTTDGAALVGTGAAIEFTTTPTWEGLHTFNAGLAIAAAQSITMGEGATIGQAAGPLITFDDGNDYLEITGCSVGIGTAAPDFQLHVEGASALFKLERQNSTGADYAPGVYMSRTRDAGANIQANDYLGKFQFVGTVAGAEENFGALVFIATNLAAPRTGYFAFLDEDIATVRMKITTDGAVTIGGTLTLANDGLHLLDTGGDHDLIITPGTDLGADRVLTLTTGDAARTITLSGNPTLADWFDQSVKQAASPTFADVLVPDGGEVGIAAAERFIFNAAGTVQLAGAELLLPNQPAFSVHMNGGDQSIVKDGYRTLEFDTETFDTGGDFNTGTYKFVAPQTGLYLLSVQARLNTVDVDADYIIVRINTSNRTYRLFMDPGGLASDPAFWPISFIVIADMDASDEAFVEVYQGAGANQMAVEGAATDTRFMGWFLG